MSDDEVSDSYEECLQSEDEIAQVTETTSHQDSGQVTETTSQQGSEPATLPLPQTGDSANTNIAPSSSAHRSTQRNPYHTRTETQLSGTGENQTSQAAFASNVSTCESRNRRRKKRQSKDQLSLTTPKQIFKEYLLLDRTLSKSIEEIWLTERY